MFILILKTLAVFILFSLAGACGDGERELEDPAAEEELVLPEAPSIETVGPEIPSPPRNPAPEIPSPARHPLPEAPSPPQHTGPEIPSPPDPVPEIEIPEAPDFEE